MRICTTTPRLLKQCNIFHTTNSSFWMNRISRAKVLISHQVQFRSASSHMWPADLNIRTGLSPIGQPVVAKATESLDLSYSLSLMTSLDEDAVHPIAYDLRQESNTQWDFGTFVLRCVQIGFLKPGMQWTNVIRCADLVIAITYIIHRWSSDRW